MGSGGISFSRDKKSDLKQALLWHCTWSCMNTNKSLCHRCLHYYLWHWNERVRLGRCQEFGSILSVDELRSDHLRSRSVWTGGHVGLARPLSGTLTDPRFVPDSPWVQRRRRDNRVVEGQKKERERTKPMLWTSKRSRLLFLHLFYSN